MEDKNNEVEQTGGTEILKIGDLVLQSSKYDVAQLGDIFLQLCDKPQFKTFMEGFSKRKSASVGYVE